MAIKRKKGKKRAVGSKTRKVGRTKSGVGAMKRTSRPARKVAKPKAAKKKGRP